MDTPYCFLLATHNFFSFLMFITFLSLYSVECLKEPKLGGIWSGYHGDASGQYVNLCLLLFTFLQLCLLPILLLFFSSILLLLTI